MEDLNDLYGGQPTWRRFLDSNYWVMVRAAVSRDLSLRWWAMRGRRTEWLKGWTDDCLGVVDPFPSTADAPSVRAYRAGRLHCGRYV